MKNQKVEVLYDNYDNLIIKCIPLYLEILRITAENLNNATSPILDIGIGTGNLEEFIFRKFPDAQVVGLDTSIDFLQQTQAKFGIKKLQLIQADIRDYKIRKDKFSVILASLVIHHFEDKEKKKLFKKIYQALAKDGSFINFDMIKPETRAQFVRLQDKLFQEWKSQGLTDEFIEEEKEEMAKRDRLVKLSKQKQWLEEIGFSFRVVYENGLFCVYKCKKNN